MKMQSMILFTTLLMTMANRIITMDIYSTESSKDYLRNVMIELQDLQTPSSVLSIYSNKNRAHYYAGKRLSGATTSSYFLPTVVYNSDDDDFPRKTLDTIETASSNNYYQQIAAPAIVPPTISTKLLGQKPLGLTKNDLQTMYTHALNTGNAISLSNLQNALNSGQLPSIVGNQLQFPASSPQQLYTYYFYPLKSFIDNLQNTGHKTINDFIPQPVDTVQPSQKQIIINPLFMAISGFLGMAMLFMLGVLMIPRIFGDFKSRLVHDELLDLTKTVSEAIDNYNTTIETTSSTLRPKTRETVMGIKTRPGHAAVVRRRRKTKRGGSSEKIRIKDG